MTFRPPVTKPTRRRTRQVDSRRAIFLNVAFGLASLAAVALLAGVLFSNWYSDHGAPIASVGGVAISKDAVRERATVNLARDERLLHDYDNLRNQGSITTTDYQQVTSPITTAEASTTLYSDALSQLTEGLTLQQYADKNGISVSDADVDAQVAQDGTLPEMRHVKVIGVEATPTPPASVATPDQEAAALAKAQGYLDSIKSGAKKWDDVYTDSQTNGVVSATGDMGMAARDGLNLDPDLIDAIFSLKNANDITTVFKGQDGIYRFATITQIVAPSVDSGWKDAIGQAASGDEYRRAARAEAIKTAIRKSVESQYVTGPTASRHVLEIFVASGYSQVGDGPEAKIRLMIFAPNHDTSTASTLDQSDPAWADAKKRADDTYAALQKDPTQFTKLAMDTKSNDDPYVASVGGDMPWLPDALFTGDPSSQAGLGMSAVPAAIFQPGLAPGLLAPILEPTMGYVVVDFQGVRPAPAQRMADAQIGIATGSDFATEVTKYSESSDVNNGGDMGWVSRHMLSSDLEDAIFQAPVGGLSRMVTTSDGLYLFKVLAEETRTPDAATQLKLKSSVFDKWLSDLTAATNIWTDSAGLTAITPAAS
ncbi:MAG: peptidylprolyl isomerase [Candidatus Limnocylindrales bacterium]|jgi:parvulin-like peptidyl-prolyl isomerase